MLNKFPKKEFRGLYKFALQRLIVDTKKFFKIVNYKIEENPTYDKKTTLVLNKIYKDLKIDQKIKIKFFLQIIQN